MEPKSAPAEEPAEESVRVPAEETAPSTVLPGEPFDIGFPRAGDILGVVSAGFDEVLSLHAVPGAEEEMVAGVNPTADNLTATGRARLVKESIWTEVAVDGLTGWVDRSFVAYIGGSTDVTSHVIAELGDTPTAETIADLGFVIAESMASADPPSTITVTVAPTAGDLADVTYDVLGLGDDSLFGRRIHVFGQRDESRGVFVLKSVESTDLCMRGVTIDDLCI